MLNSFKSYIKRKIVRKKIVPIVIKDIESNLLVGKKAFITGGVVVSDLLSQRNSLRQGVKLLLEGVMNLS